MKSRTKNNKSDDKKRDRSRNQKDSEFKLENFTIILKCELKTPLEDFVDREIKKKINKINIEVFYKKQKNFYTFTFLVKDKKICDEILQKSLGSDLYKNDEMKVFLNDEEIFIEKDNIVDDIQETKINEEKVIPNVQQNIREITVSNIPDKLQNEKIYEIFFIYGDISKMEFNREEKKAFIMYKYCSSAEKAFRKSNKENQTMNWKVEISDIKTRPGIDQDEDELRNSGVVVYLKFEHSDKVPNKEEIKRQLKKFGLVTKVFRKKEGRSYYIEFSDSSSTQELIMNFRAGSFNLKGLKEIDYAFNKDNNKEVIITEEKKEENKEESFISINDVNPESNVEINKFDPNKHWQVYFDDNYQKNYYFNPFFNQSVWELPENGEISQYQSAELFYDPEAQQNNQNEINQQTQEENQNEQKESHQNFYDEEAWEDDELMEKLVWDKMKEQQLKEWMKRPARHQVTDTRRDTAYVEGNYDYNIWYDKYLTDRKEEKEKIPALHRCNPALDTGYTKADLQEKEGGGFFCRFFAKGCCSEGVNCRYYHKVPTKEDVEKIENLRDVFGRARFANHRTDMGGVGSFTKECNSLFVSDLKLIETANPIKEMVRVIYENFSPYGEIEDVNYVPAKAACFIRFSHRCFAEFAKEAMIGQSLVGEEIITVKWAYDDPNPMNKKRTEKENENRFVSAHNRKQENLIRIKERTQNKALPTTDYYNYYNDKNNPYGYSYGYGQEENKGENAIVDESSQNYMKLSDTLKRIEEMNENEN